jgi:hypothetical protein
VAGAAISANAMRDATNAQINALRQQRDFVFNNLNPNVVNAQSTAADVQNAQARLALQGQIDPALLQQRYQAEAAQGAQLDQLGRQSGQVMNAATSEALAGTPGANEAKSKLIDAALGNLKAGATLPPDVQAELVKAGLEQSGMVTGAASGKGVGGQLLRTIIGQAGINLQMQRQQQAAQLATTASNLDATRQNILQGLFPRLASTQLSNLGGAQSVLNNSNSLMPQAGLTGSDVANIWLARVGATNQLSQSAADAQARNSIGQGQIWGNAVGGAGTALGNAIPLSTVSGWINGGGGGGQSMNAQDGQMLSSLAGL